LLRSAPPALLTALLPDWPDAAIEKRPVHLMVVKPICLSRKLLLFRGLRELCQCCRGLPWTLVHDPARNYRFGPAFFHAEMAGAP
jgi:hypothetical protein